MITSIALSLFWFGSASAAPVGQSGETLGAALERAPLSVVASVMGRSPVGRRYLVTQLRIERVLHRAPGISSGLQVGLVIQLRTLAKLDHAVRLETGERALVFLRENPSRRFFEGLAAIVLTKDEDGRALEAAAIELAAAQALGGVARDQALVRVFSKQAREQGPAIARDAALELVRAPRLGRLLPIVEQQGLVLRLEKEPNSSPAKLALIELCGSLKAPGTAAALVAALGAPKSARICGLACRALKHLDEGTTGPQLIEALGAAKLPGGRLSLIRAIEELEFRAAQPELQKLIDAKGLDATVRAAALRAIRRFERPAVKKRPELVKPGGSKRTGPIFQPTPRSE